MATVHKIEVYGGPVTIYAKEGETVNFQGVPMVQMRHGTIVKPEGFHASLADAKREAADRIDAIRQELAGRAEQLRAEADAIEAKEAVA
jgi:hypothetical protein